MSDVNNRQAQRHKVLKSGRIVLDAWRTLECGVRDLSATGAKLTFDPTTPIPDVFRLVLKGDNTIRPAKVAWRKGETVGVHFTGEAKPATLRKT
jgi:hypothetical protein